jgi:hypothetical protein
MSVDATDGVVYATGAIVVCYACGIPLYRLQANIYAGEKPSRSAWKYAPVSLAELQALQARADLEPGQRAAIKALSLADQRTHCETIRPLTTGAPLDCPRCHESFVYGRSPSAAALTDRAFVIHLATIPPRGQSRRVA